MSETITGMNQYTVFKADNGYAVCKYLLDDGTHCTVVGQIPDTKNVKISLTGNWEVSKKYGKQFKTEKYEIQMPDDEKGIISYLVSLKCGIGRTWAKRIYSAFEDKTWEVLESEPNKLLTVKGFGKRRLNGLVKKMNETQSTRAIMSLFSGVVDITTKKAEIIAKVLGGDAVETIKTNPYKLCGIKGLGFMTVENIAKHFNGKPDDLLRIQGCIFYLLEEIEVRGHSCYLENMFIKRLHTILNAGYDTEVVSETLCRNALDYLVKYKKCFRETFADSVMIYSSESYMAESGIASNIARIQNGFHMPLNHIDEALAEYDTLNSFNLAETQKEAIKTSLSNRISIITGGPGTGKTTITKAILYLHDKLCINSKPLLLAPTGRAARRMSEATNHLAYTIHSGIGIVQNEDGSTYSTVEELDNNLIIVDESSMIDQKVANHLFSVIPDDAIVILVGDPDQLPSVGAGNVLLDIINSSVVPVTKLEVIFRQEEDSPIIYNAQAILKGNTDLNYSKGFYLKECESSKATLREACKFYAACVNKFGIDNVALLTPFRKDDDLLSVPSFNTQLQHHLNPPKGGDELVLDCHNTQFRKGDRIMQMKNTNIAKNGDVGYIKDICYGSPSHGDTSFTTLCNCEFNNDGTTIPYSKEDMNNVELGYASTVHKSQGSEYKTVIIVMSMTHKIALRRNLIYTAITRAAENVAIIGQKEALDYAISNNQTDVRCTCLKQRLNKVFANPGGNILHQICNKGVDENEQCNHEEEQLSLF